MKVAQNMGIHVPNMCWHDELEHFTSCMLCVMKDQKNGQLFPSCSVKVTEGMEIITDDAEISEARKTALELLLSEHVGDCEAPCQIACPAHINIPLMNRLIAAEKFDESLAVVRRDIALPAVLGRICPAPCENACHRKTVDEAISICLLKRFVGDEFATPKIIPAAKTGKKAAVIGAGPAGLAAAYYLQLKGVQVTLFDKNEYAGGMLRTAISAEILPLDVLDKEIDIIINTGIDFQRDKEITAEIFQQLKNEFDAVIVATGTVSEKSEFFGLEKSPKGIIADKDSYQTSDEKVFAVGNVLRSSRLAVRSVAQGKEVAFSVLQLFNEQKPEGEPRMFNSRFGKLMSAEFSEYKKETVGKKRDSLKSPFATYRHCGLDPQSPDNQTHVLIGIAGQARNDGPLTGFTKNEAIAKALLCLHCDCRAVNTCKLREYSNRYQADQKRFKTGERQNITKQMNHDLVVYEAQKCIKCGICVRLSKKYDEKLGLTYIGRGFDVKIGVPFNEELKNGLEKIAVKVAENCPTGGIKKV